MLVNGVLDLPAKYYDSSISLHSQKAERRRGEEGEGRRENEE